MYTYDFDAVIDRHHTDSMKWNVAENELPMWVADMDFQVAPEIRQRLQARLDHGIFGYSTPSERWYNAYMEWWATRHQFKIKREWLHFVEGIVPAVASAIRKLSSPGEKVLLMTPVYNHFFYSIRDTGRIILESPLQYENGVYAIDWTRLEHDLSDPQTTLMILCNPQNPTGNLWSAAELAKIGELAVRHHVTILADEIHCDVTSPGYDYTPFASVNETRRNNCVMFMSPTKSFNIAGIKTAAVCVPDPRLRNKMWAALKSDEIAGVNFFALEAAIAAFTTAAPWLDQVRAYIEENRQCVADFLSREIPHLHLISAHATYLLWIDVSALPGKPTDFSEFLRQNTGLFVSDGNVFGEAGKHFFRLNIACPRSLLRDGLERLKKGVQCYCDEHQS